MLGLLEEATKYFEYDPEWLRKTEVNKHETNSIISMRILCPPQPTHGRQNLVVMDRKFVVDEINGILISLTE